MKAFLYIKASMRPPKSPYSRPNLDSRPKSRPAAGKLRSFRPLPYHIVLNQAARLEAWTQEATEFGVPPEAVDSSDFDPRLMERE
jgi:hypothetical protein